MIITFIGHSSVAFHQSVKESVKKIIKSNLINVEYITCYLGSYGDFDNICAYACKELKQQYKNIEIAYVTPYISLIEQEKIKKIQACGLYDISIYPPIENTPPKFAILKRNEWMIANADLVIAYVCRSYGGAYKAMQLAKKMNKKIINIYDLAQ